MRRLEDFEQARENLKCNKKSLVGDSGEDSKDQNARMVIEMYTAKAILMRFQMEMRTLLGIK